MAKEDSISSGESRLHDATTPAITASLQASLEALDRGALPGGPPDLRLLIEGLEGQVEAVGYVDVIHNLGTAYLASGRPQDAVELFSQCVERNPDFVEAWVNLAFTRLQLGLGDDAGIIFPRILKSRAANADLHNLYGLFLALQGNYPDAISEYQRALALHPEFDLAHNNLALAFEALGQHEEAREQFAAAGSLTQLYQALGIISDGEVVPEAVEQFRAKVQGNPLRATVFYEAAFFFASREEREKALRMLGEALVLEPDVARYFTSLGFLELNWGDEESAVEHLQTAIEIDRGAYEAHIHLGFHYGVNEEMDKVLEHFRRAVELRPYYPDLHFNLGEGLLDVGETEEAISCFRHALRLHPWYGMALFKLGHACLEANHSEQAVEAFKRLRENDPEFPDLDEFLDQAMQLSKQ